MKIAIIQRMFLAGTAALFVACGGGPEGDVNPGGGGTACPGCEPVGVPPAGVTLGAVAGTSPLQVNGITFSVLPGTSVVVADGDDDGRGPQVGMIARVQGGLGAGSLTGTVNSLGINAELRGPIQAIDAAAGRFTLLGVAVQTNTTTSFEYQPSGVDPMPLKVGDMLQVHGYTNGSTLAATRVIKRVTNNVFKTTGAVSYANCPNCQTFGRAFFLGSLYVSVPENVVLKGVSWPVAEGALVRVKLEGAPVNGFASAAEIAAYGGAPLLADAITRLRGFVAQRDGAQFQVQGIAAALAAQVEFSQGTAADFANGRLVEVQGIYRSGIIQTNKVTFID
jgi:hypothetical protein